MNFWSKLSGVPANATVKLVERTVSTLSFSSTTPPLLNFTGYETVTKDFPSHETVQFYINGKVATRMVEGCNAVSVMIMFLAFVFAFYKGVKTFYFAFAGIVLLYILNLFRIYVLNVIVVDFPALTKPAHDYFFPAIIYGGVVILWLIWINKFIVTHEKNS